MVHPQNGGNAVRDSPFIKTLVKVRRSVLWETLAKRFTLAIWTWLAVAVTFMSFDAAWSLVGAHFADDPYKVYELPIWWRVIVSAILGAGLVWVATRLYLPRAIRQRPLSHYASIIEQQVGIEDGHLTDAADLAVNHQHDPLGEALRDRIVTRADHTLAGIKSRKSGVRSHWTAASIVSVGLLCQFAMPYVCFDVFRDWSRTDPSLRTVWRYIEPLADHPPVTPLTLTTDVDFPFGRLSELREINGQYWLGVYSQMSETPEVRLTVIWASGAREQFMVHNDPDHGLLYRIPATDEAFRYIFHAANSRSRWNKVTPVAKPRFGNLELSIASDGRQYQLDPTVDPVRVAVGSELLIKVDPIPATAVLTHPGANGTTLRVQVRQGVQDVKLNLITPSGVTSEYGRMIRIVGLSQSTIDQINAELAGGELPEDAISLPVAADALAAAVAFGSPDEATAAELASGTPVEGQPTGNEPPQNGTGASGDGTGGDGDNAEPPPLVDAVGVLAARYDVKGDDLQELRRLVRDVPPAYRDLVAEYLLKRRERE